MKTNWKKLLIEVIKAVIAAIAGYVGGTTLF